MRWARLQLRDALARWRHGQASATRQIAARLARLHAPRAVLRLEQPHEWHAFATWRRGARALARRELLREARNPVMMCYISGNVSLRL